MSSPLFPTYLLHRPAFFPYFPSRPLPPPFILSPTRSDAPSSGIPPPFPISVPTSSPRLLLPSASRREDRPEVTLPPRKRLGIALGPRYEVGESSSAATARPAGGLRADYGFVATMDREIRRDLERDVGYRITDSLSNTLIDLYRIDDERVKTAIGCLGQLIDRQQSLNTYNDSDAVIYKIFDHTTGKCDSTTGRLPHYRTAGDPLEVPCTAQAARGGWKQFIDKIMLLLKMAPKRAKWSNTVTTTPAPTAPPPHRHYAQLQAND
ncbi:hypothetical protein Tco_1383226 [Tanacetum coccineum]